MAVGQYTRLLGAAAKPVTKVDIYHNPDVQTKFKAKEAEFKAAGKETNKLWVFHGTPATENVPKICEGGFKVGGQDGWPITNGAVYGQVRLFEHICSAVFVFLTDSALFLRVSTARRDPQHLQDTQKPQTK